MELYVDNTSFHLEVYRGRCPRTSLLDWGYLAHSTIQMASTSLLLAGEDAGDPADRKHLCK